MKDTTAIGLGLFGAWAVHNIEELFTMATTSRRVLTRSPRWLPISPRLQVRGISRAQVNLTVAMMAPVVAAASWSGVRSEGRSVLFRGAVLAFGAHGLAHLGNAAVAQGYTTGLLTTPTVVLPYWWLAWRGGRRKALLPDGHSAHSALVAGVALAGLPLLGLMHYAAWRILGDRAFGE